MRDFFTAGMRSPARLLVPAFVALALASCGGGGGGGSSNTGCPGGFLTCNGTDTDTTAQAPKFTLTLVDAGTGALSNNLTSGKPLTVRALLLTAAGAPLANKEIGRASCRERV